MSTAGESPEAAAPPGFTGPGCCWRSGPARCPGAAVRPVAARTRVGRPAQVARAPSAPPRQPLGQPAARHRRASAYRRFSADLVSSGGRARTASRRARTESRTCAHTTWRRQRNRSQVSADDENPASRRSRGRVFIRSASAAPGRSSLAKNTAVPTGVIDLPSWPRSHGASIDLSAFVSRGRRYTAEI